MVSWQGQAALLMVRACLRDAVGSTVCLPHLAGQPPLMLMGEIQHNTAATADATAIHSLHSSSALLLRLTLHGISNTYREICRHRSLIMRQISLLVVYNITNCTRENTTEKYLKELGTSQTQISLHALHINTRTD